ncbi:aminotransferase class V-fold PLP-dependent enzyme [Pseudoxanthomonas sp.]|uniref:aminotransferase class V-fold PLP-dependent enzyme n=1 Tax=Pseudoxanthomonas sp. TaxID=1871049 RepID=UPI00260C4CBA|nr:aminotransferase class V-fold PLP-dependent enzyme [Pseudoxanthomonas sp.]WDS34887.1 MAG: aminotransferase class V-fold PLP-dependent enzyme [Pseudoxanthomonas sp.]
MPPVAWEDRHAAFALPDDVRYLDVASTGPRLASVQAAAHAAVELAATPWRSPHDAVMQQVQSVRQRAADLLFGGDVDGVAMIPSAAYGLATAARNVPLARGDAVLVLDGQFPSNLIAWQQRCAEVGAQVVAATPAPGQSLTDAVLAQLQDTPRIAVVSLPHCHWHDGRLLDLDRIAPAVQARGAALVLDLSQSAGVLPVRLDLWKPDFVVSVGYKWLLGPIGLSWLWAAPRWRSQGTPIEQHWITRDPGADWTFPIAAPPPFLPGARRFDAGAINDPIRLAMAAAGLAQLQHWGLPRIAAALAEVTAALDAALEARGLADWKTPGHAPHLTGLRVPGARLDAVAAAFAAHRILCARRQGGLRLAPSLTVRPAQMQAVVEIAASA